MTLAPSSGTAEPGEPARRLPMLHRTQGARSPVTCHLKCADACTHPIPNTSANPTFRDIASVALTRRQTMGLAAAGAVTLIVGGSMATAPPAAAEPITGADRGWWTGSGGRLPFQTIGPIPADRDAVSVPAGYTSAVIIRWGDPLVPGLAGFDPTTLTGSEQAQRFGYNNDYLDIIVTGRSTALLVCNHEYTNENIMFPDGADPARADEIKRIAIAAHGMSVVDLVRRRSDQPWTYQVGGRSNRRITASTPFAMTGPAAGDPLLQTSADPAGRTVLGTLGNCSGGTTPWGTVLSGEENFNGFFRSPGTSGADKRYGLTDRATARGWETVDPRFDARNPGYEHEPNRFGWIVEVDPTDPTSTPQKHTALGRLKHEGANIALSRDGRAVAYMGDDERFDYLYKFVSTRRMRRGRSQSARKHNLTLLHDGDLYVARFTGDSPTSELDGTGKLPSDKAFDGSGQWIPLVRDGTSQVTGMSVQDVLVFTRLAADKVGATKMDRCEDVQPSPITGKVYVACTNNTDRGNPGKEGATEVNPRTANKDGHIVEITERWGDAAATSFGWSLLLVCGNPADPKSKGTYFAGYPADKVSPISCPDNVAFDSAGDLWIATDGQPSAIGYSDGLYKVPLSGRERGHVLQFLAVPTGAETCGPVIHDEDATVFVAVQHPGEDGTYANPQSRWPDQVGAGRSAEPGQFAGPRPSIVQVYRDGR